MKIHIYKDPSALLGFLILIYTMLIGFFTYNFGVSESAFYLQDLLIILMVATSLRRLSQIIKERGLRAYGAAVIMLCVTGLLSAVMYNPTPHITIWSLRNWGRGILFFLLCCAILDQKKIDTFIKLFITVYQINVLVVLIQYFFFVDRYTVDSLNGLFGRGTSSVNLTATFIMLVLALSQFFTKKISLGRFVFYLLGVNAVAIVAELKSVMVMEVVLVFLYGFLHSKLTGKQVVRYGLIVSATLVCAYVGAQLLAKLYPAFADFLSLENLLSIIGNEHGYGFSGYIDRTNFISVTNKHLFNGNVFQMLFGVGLGTAEYSAVSMFCSDFYRKFGDTYRYMRFSSSALYVETGLVGLSLFTLAHLSLLINNIKNVRRHIKNNTEPNSLYDNIGLGTTIVSVVYIFYNNLHRTDIAVLLAFFSAIPIAIARSRKAEKHMG